MAKYFRIFMVFACAAWLFSPLSSTLQTVSAAPILSVTPSSAAPGDWVQVSGAGFTPAGGTYGLLGWNTLGIESASIGRSQEGSDGSMVFNVQVPPTAQPGTSFFYVHTVVQTGTSEHAQVYITVTASTHKIALITPAVATAADDAFKALLDAFSLPTTEIPLTQIKDSDSFSAYDEVLIAADTAAVGATGWGTPAARSALGRFGKPILGIGDGGYYYFGTKGLPIGWGNGTHGSGTAIVQTARTMPIYRTPYTVSPVEGTTTLFATASATVEFYLPQNDGSLFEFAQNSITSPDYYILLQNGPYFMWGFDGSPSTMTAAGERLFVNVAWYLLNILNRDTLVVSNLSRMQTLGYPAADVTDLYVHLTTLVGRPYVQSNMNAAWVDLAVDAPASLASTYTSWAGAMGDVNWNNTLVHAIDGYLENLKHAAYPNLKYFILAGSEEIIPMLARPVDNYEETGWSLPEGYLKSLYHSTANGAASGYYLTDTIYSDLSYINDGWGVDNPLMPEMSVGRLVETPAQISTLINNYLAAEASMSRTNLVAMASDDYMDGATFAANAMGPTADSSMIVDGFPSILVPDELNVKHSVVYIGGHGDYNWMTTQKWDQGFQAGAIASQGNTEDLNNLPNAVIAAAGCHNGVLLPDMSGYNYDGGIIYGDFPERLAAHQVGVYVASTGYTWVTLSGNSTNPADTGYSEKAAALFIQHLLNDGNTTAGKAFQAAAKQYLNDRGVGHLDGGDRRAISVLTFYGFPTYRFKTFYFPIYNKFAYSLVFQSLLQSPSSTQSPSAVQATATATLDVAHYTVNSDGTVTIPGADYAGDSNHPLLPVVTTSLDFPGPVTGLSLSLDAPKSTYVTLTNDVPAVQAGTFLGNGTIYKQPIVETFTGFYPTDGSLIYSTTTTPLGGSGVELNFGIVPVQYDKDTHTTKIWTHLVFNITYSTDTSLSSLDSDGDGLPDWWEVAHGLDPYSAVGDNGASGDPDHDSLTNLQEYLHGTDPMNPDTDHDGYSDGLEVKLGTNPLDPGSAPIFIFLPIIHR